MKPDVRSAHSSPAACLTTRLVSELEARIIKLLDENIQYQKRVADLNRTLAEFHTSPELAARWAEHGVSTDLETLSATMVQSLPELRNRVDRAYAAGAADRQAKIVGWLRTCKAGLMGKCPNCRTPNECNSHLTDGRRYADVIERGDWEGKP